MNRWDDYLAHAAQLDDVRRESATVVATQQSAVAGATAELVTVRQRTTLQRGRLIDVAAGIGRAAPTWEPTDPDRTAAAARLGADLLIPAATDEAASPAEIAAAVTAALQSARAALDGADATLSSVTNAPAQRGLLAGRPPGVRNAIVYGWFALLALVAVIEINAIAGSSLQAAVVIAVFSLIIPAIAWVLGALSLWLLFGRRTPLDAVTARLPADGAYRPSGSVVGAVLCAVPLVIGVILSAV